MPVPGVDDSQEFRATAEAMTIMGISAEEQAGKTVVGNQIWKRTQYENNVRGRNWNITYTMMHMMCDP